MNSMNFFSALGTATPPTNTQDPSDPRISSAKEIQRSDSNHTLLKKQQSDTREVSSTEECEEADANGSVPDENTPLLQSANPKQSMSQKVDQPTLVRRVAGAIAAFLPVYKLGRLVSRRHRKKSPSEMEFTEQDNEKPDQDGRKGRKSGRPLKRTPATISADSESKDEHELVDDTDSPARNTRSHSASSVSAEDEDNESPKRSIRIKVLNEDALRQRKQRREQQVPLTVATVKSPTSPPSLGLTKYPRSPALPRPLIPRRQPSYTFTLPSMFGNSPSAQKTLIIDLDETLIHSMAKGGRMSTGHMVEVKLQSPVGVGGAVLGPQVPILYYVHKRPHCDEFLRKVSKWYNLVVFTASVQEYADPVIDWLELERKYFSKRYYRQHCTYRNGAYIKDLGHVEPDLSNAIILDNSPLSYAFHQDNAVPIEGWISDPTDNNLLHLIPLFEGLQYTTDVRSLLALRQGEPSG